MTRQDGADDLDRPVGRTAEPEATALRREVEKHYATQTWVFKTLLWVMGLAIPIIVVIVKLIPSINNVIPQ